MNVNMYYEALMEGRWRPTINVDKQEDGNYRAFYESNGITLETIDSSREFAYNDVGFKLREAVRNGQINPR